MIMRGGPLGGPTHNIRQRVVNSALWLPRQTDHYVVAPVGRVAVNAARRVLPPGIRANRVVQRVWNEVRDRNSPVRLGVDSAVAYGGVPVVLSILDAITSGRLWGSIADLYTKHPIQAGLATASGLAGIVAAADVVVSATRHAYVNAATRTGALARNGAELGAALILLASAGAYDRFDRGSMFIWEKPSAPAATATAAPTATPTATPFATATPILTPTPPAAFLPPAAFDLTPSPTATLEAVVAGTPTPEATATPTPYAAATATPTVAPQPTPTPYAIATPTTTPTITSTPQPTSTPTATPVPTVTPTAVPSPTATPTPVNLDAIVNAVRWGVSYNLAKDMHSYDKEGFYAAFGVVQAARAQVPGWFDGNAANGEVTPLNGIAVEVNETVGKSKFRLQGNAAATFTVQVPGLTDFLVNYLQRNPSRVGEVTVITPGQR